jgi:calcineurin-like phosphoesterase family protein
MSLVYFIGDLHFGHKKVGTEKYPGKPFRTEFKSVEEHDEFLCAKWRDKIKQRDLVFVLGDCAFGAPHLERFAELPGRKILVRGNHDTLSAQRYLVFFEDIFGLHKIRQRPYGTFWLSHCPIHPQELRGGRNIHGHVHSNTVCGIEHHNEGYFDSNYMNASAEMIGYEPRTIEELIEINNADGHLPEMALAAKPAILAE